MLEVRTGSSGSDVTEYRTSRGRRAFREVCSQSGSRVTAEVTPASRRGNRHPPPRNNGTRHGSCFSPACQLGAPLRVLTASIADKIRNTGFKSLL
jgi:hypothetical protein